MSFITSPAPSPRTLLIVATAMSLSIGAASAAPSPSPRPAPAPSPRSAPAPAPRPAPAPAPKPSPAPAPKPSPAPAPAAKPATSFGSFGSSQKAPAQQPQAAKPSVPVGSFGGSPLTASPNSVARPAQGLAADLGSAAARKQAIEVYETRKADQVSKVAAPAVAAQLPAAVAAQRDHSAATAPSGIPSTGSIPAARYGSNDTYYQQRLEDERRRARMAEDDRDDAERRARRAQIRAVEADIASAQARRRVMAGAAVGGAAGYAGASAFEDAPVTEPIAVQSVPQVQPPVLAERGESAAAASEYSTPAVLQAFGWTFALGAMAFMAWSIFKRFVGGSSRSNKGRYTL